MNLKSLLIIGTFFALLNVMFAADKDTTVRKEIHAELHATFSMESNTANKFLSIGILDKYDLTTNGELSAILDLDFMYGIGPTKKVSDVNFLAGLRSTSNHEQFRFYYEVSTGIGFVDNHDGTSGYAGNYSRLKVGFRYAPVALEISVGTFVSKDFTISPISGIGLAVSL